jgi:hypothetical protein
MTYSNVSLVDLIRAGELRAGSYVSCTLPYNRGVCKGVLQSNGKIAFGIGGRSAPFTLNRFVVTVFGRPTNGWMCVYDEHGVALDLVRARFRRARGIEHMRRRNGDVHRTRREPTDTFDQMRMVGVVVSDGNEERVIRT